jgi:ZU5 domain-containing protein
MPTNRTGKPEAPDVGPRTSHIPMQPMKRINSTLAVLAFAALAFAASSCVDSTAPSGDRSSATPSALLGDPPEASGIPGGGLGDGVGRLVDTTVTVLQRLVPLTGDITVSAVIDSAGGSIEIPEAGFRLDIPKKALDEPTTITVTAVQGSAAAYEFEPQGLAFNKRLFITQDLSVTGAISNLLGTDFTGAYFQSRDEISPLGSATVHELLPTKVDLFLGTVEFPVKHFSGYLVAVD